MKRPRQSPIDADSKQRKTIVRARPTPKVGASHRHRRQPTPTRVLSTTRPSCIVMRSGSSGGAITPGRTSFLERQQLFRPESLVMDLGGSLDQVLQMGAKQEITKVHEFAVALVLDVDDSPTVLTSANGLAVNDHVALGSNDREGDHGPDRVVVL